MSDKTISIGFRIDDAGDGFKKLVEDARSFGNVMEGTAERVKGSMKDIMDFTQVSEAYDTVAQSLSDIQGVLDEYIQAYEVQEEAETKLTVVMRERMNATEANIQAIKDLCSAQQVLGVIGDEVQLAGAQQLATFLSQQSALEALLPAMNNLVAQQKGLNATSNDAVSIANLFGKAMQGQTSALRKVGITFSEAEEAALKMGTEEERAAMLAKIITNNVGEMNAALAQTSTGKLKQAENSIGDIKEQIGGYVKSIAPAVAAANQLVMAIGNIGKVNAAITAAWTAMKGLASGTAAAAMTVRALNVALKATIAGAVITAALWALNKAMEAFAGSTEEAAGNMGALNDEMSEEERQMQSLHAQLQAHIAKVTDFKGSKEEEIKIVEELNNTYGETMGYFSTVADWYKALTANSEDYCRQMIIEARTRKIADQMATHAKAMADIKYDKNGKLRKYSTKDPYAERNKAFTNGTLGADGKPMPKIDVPGWNGKHQQPKLTYSPYSPHAIAQRTYRNHEKEMKMLEEQMAEVQKEAQSINFSVRGSSTRPNLRGSGKGSSGRSAASAAAQAPPPEGSIADYEKQIQETEQKIRVTVDDSQLVELERRKLELQDKVSVIRANVRWQLEKADFNAKADEIKLDPITIDVGIDTKKLDSDIAAAAENMKRLNQPAPESEQSTKRLSKEMQGLEKSAQAAAGAFQGMGQAFDLPEMDVAGTIAGAIASMIGAYGAAQIQSTEMGPWAWIAFALTGLATLTTIVASVKNMAAFADGGIAYGPAIGLFGEYAGAAHNPEVVAPLDRLQGMLAQEGGANIALRAVVEGDKIILATANATRRRSLSGRSGGINV